MGNSTAQWLRCIPAGLYLMQPQCLRLAKMARWKPLSEDNFSDEDDIPFWEEQDVNVSGAVLHRLYKSTKWGCLA